MILLKLNLNYLISAIFLFQWSDCLVIGRDFVRLLQNVARLQEFESLWRDMMLNPTSLCPQFTGKRK